MDIKQVLRTVRDANSSFALIARDALAEIERLEGCISHQDATIVECQALVKTSAEHHRQLRRIATALESAALNGWGAVKLSQLET